jgi:hypothetical protein
MELNSHNNIMRTYGYDVSSRILNRSIKRENGCIEYRGDKPTKHPYGLISITINGYRKSIPAHRAIYMALNDCFDLSRNIVVRHKCDNPRCVNIEHLIKGTFKENMYDCIIRKRRASNYKLHTRERVISNETIKAIRDYPKAKLYHIAEMYGVSPGYVSKIRNMKAKTLL